MIFGPRWFLLALAVSLLAEKTLDSKQVHGKLEEGWPLSLVFLQFKLYQHFSTIVTLSDYFYAYYMQTNTGTALFLYLNPFT